MVSYRTGLSRARGLGSAKHGVGLWISERVSSVALIFLCAWMVWAAFYIAGHDYYAVGDFVRQPLNAVLLVLLTVVSFWHMHAGLRVVVEDYIHKTLSKSLILLLNLFVCVLGGALAAFCIVRVALGAQ
jgi:succinate dehydrogenase / fumarate reductase, membrane anchor subunit